MRAAEAIPSRPALRWHGGKWLLAPWIHEHLPKHRVYVEPFGGAASVLLRKKRSYAEVYNDLDVEVVNLFRVLQSRSAELHTLLRLTPFARDEFNLAYGAVTDDVERARRLIIRSFMGFGSNGHARVTGFRANSNRSGTTPAHDWVNYVEVLPLLIERLAGVVIENRNAVDVISAHDGPETLLYVDPPYVHSTRSDMGKDYAHELTDDDHRQLASVLHKVRGMVVLSGYPCEMYNELYAGWRVETRNSLADGARERTECLWINEAASVRLKPVARQLQMFAI